MLTSRKFFLFLIPAILSLMITSPNLGQNLIEKSNSKNHDFKFDIYGQIIYSNESGKINYAQDEFNLGNRYSKINNFNLEDKVTNSQINKSLIDSLILEQYWKTGIFGSGIGLSGIVTNDIDNDNTLEIICGGSTGTFGEDNF